MKTMKKTNILSGLGVISIAILVTACDGISTNPGPDFTMNNTSIVLEPGETTASITGSINADAGLASVVVTKVVGASEQEIGNYNSFDSAPITTDDDISYVVNLTVTDIEENCTVTLEATDNEDNVSSVSVDIEVADIALFEVVLMGAQSNADYGSTASLTTGEVFKITGGEAANNSDLVDIVYYYGSRLAALYSPSQEDIQAVGAFNITSWNNVNTTLLGESTLSATGFDDLATAAEIAGAGTPDLDVVPDLALDDVIVFETESGKKGVFKVSELNTGASGDITISVKIER